MHALKLANAMLFLSTLSLRRATQNRPRPSAGINDFYPRSPCGERQRWKSTERPKGSHFYPRSPCGERRAGRGHVTGGQKISIHALLAESDAAIVSRSSISCQFLSTLSLRRATLFLIWVAKTLTYFYPRSPCGERLGAPVDRMPSSSISIHALLAESDSKSAQNSGALLRI